MDLLKEFFGTADDDAEAAPAAPAGETTGRTEEERQHAREAKREAEKAAAQAPRCGQHAGIFCVLAKGHLSVNPWHQDEHGALFQGDE